MNTSPSHKERTKKLREAAEALNAKRAFAISEERHFTEDMQELKSSSAEKHFLKILKFLEEINESGGADCYVGPFPAYKSYHKGFTDVTLFAFAWESKTARKRMYLKFGIRRSSTGEPNFLYLNCHKDDPEKKRR